MSEQEWQCDCFYCTHGRAVLSKLEGSKSPLLFDDAPEEDVEFLAGEGIPAIRRIGQDGVINE